MRQLWHLFPVRELFKPQIVHISQRCIQFCGKFVVFLPARQSWRFHPITRARPRSFSCSPLFAYTRQCLARPEVFRPARKFSLQWLMRTLSGNMVFSVIPISQPFFLYRGGHDAGWMWWELFLFAADPGTLVCSVKKHIDLCGFNFVGFCGTFPS